MDSAQIPGKYILRDAYGEIAGHFYTFKDAEYRVNGLNLRFFSIWRGSYCIKAHTLHHVIPKGFIQ